MARPSCEALKPFISNAGRLTSEGLLESTRMAQSYMEGEREKRAGLV